MRLLPFEYNAALFCISAAVAAALTTLFGGSPVNAPGVGIGVLVGMNLAYNLRNEPFENLDGALDAPLAWGFLVTLFAFVTATFVDALAPDALTNDAAWAILAGVAVALVVAVYEGYTSQNA